MAIQPTFDFENDVRKYALRVGLVDPDRISWTGEAEIFPITVIQVEFGSIKATGWAICNDHDVYDPNIGKRLALTRALRLLKKKLNRRKTHA